MVILLLFKHMTMYEILSYISTFVIHSSRFDILKMNSKYYWFAQFKKLEKTQSFYVFHCITFFSLWRQLQGWPSY